MHYAPPRLNPSNKIGLFISPAQRVMEISSCRGVFRNEPMIALDFGPRFSLGRIVATPNVLAQVPTEDIRRALVRHVRGDWGELGAEDRQENERSLLAGCRLLSAYRATDGTTFWIITEADRSATTVLLPEDY